ncbi:MAG: class I SAM-dependent methyltransferase [Flavobacteriales bacterium]
MVVGENNSEEWFENWFNTKWYHMLYQNRDLKEAEKFIQALIHKLQLPKSSVLLDAACGAGRHSAQLNAMGYEVHGFDLSEESIDRARVYESDSLKFSVADLRSFRTDKKFDAVFSFFTSFGYFETEKETIAVLENFRNALNPKGILMIDFLNAVKVKDELVLNESKTVDGIEFRIKRKLNKGRIEKDIQFIAESKEYNFSEKVSAFEIKDFEQMLEKTSFRIKEIYGSYLLDDFSVNQSPRLIILAEQIL